MANGAVPTVALAGDVAMPSVGLGTWPLAGVAAEEAVAQALSRGYRSIDTAAVYRNERSVGRAIAASGLERSEVFVTTKLARTAHGYDTAMRAVDESLRELALDHVDLYLIHWPMPALGLYVDSWRALIDVQAEGRVRAIGVSNFKPAHIERLVDETGVVPAVNQIELNPRTNRADARAYHRRRGIVTQSWAPLGSGTDLLSEPVITQLATKYRKRPGQIVLRWHMELGLVATPRSGNPVRIAENIDVFDFRLTDDETRRVSALDTGSHPPVDSDTFTGPPTAGPR
jgi:2,5-diketo-D-gluconate reductase A